MNKPAAGAFAGAGPDGAENEDEAMNMLARIVVLGGLGLTVVACTTTQERVGGAGAGALAGAAVGGPVGAAVGGVAGAVTGPTVASATGVNKKVTTKKAKPRRSGSTSAPKAPPVQQ